MNKKLLLDLFHLPSQPGLEGKVQDFIADFLTQNKVEFEVDEVGNIFNISKKDRPLISAHMDTVQDDFDTLMTKFIGIKNGIVKGYGVIGGDDKCGIYAILELLENGHRDFNFIFSVQEETGGIGIEHFTRTQDLSHILWGIVLDRRGKSDILCEKGHEYGTKNFEKALLTVGENFGFTVGQGTFSDADYLSDQISCANLSIGYYNAHYKNEYVVLSELQNTINFVHYLIKHLDVKFEAPEKIFSYSNWTRQAYGYYDDGYYLRDEYSNMRVDTCDICASVTDDIRDMKTLGFKLCADCRTDLLMELEEENYYDYSDEYRVEG